MLLAFGELHISVDVSTLYVISHRRMETGRWYQQDEIIAWRQSHSKMESSHIVCQAPRVEKEALYKVKGLCIM